MADSKIQVQKIDRKKLKKLTLETIEASMGVIPNPRYRAKQVYRLEGLGSIFSGKYYTRRVVHTISSSGYTVDADVVNVDHIKVLELVTTAQPTVTTKPPQIQSSPKPAQPNSKLYKVVKGDTLSSIAKKYGTTWQKLFDMNKGTINNPNLVYYGTYIKVP